ncbi:hypothetical protein BSL78_24889 [Apostichopus japonicus]|uniref:Uncharacterized protein n=1 Tax=Stichopus japonicus TaxID=307972 RepID=A0A2G8JRB8_STIJA|nr:hypothetical protein BSL78_24889 [Apostichopus japonicus]
MSLPKVGSTLRIYQGIQQQSKGTSHECDCNFIENIPSYSYGDGEVDTSLFCDDELHLSQLGSDKLKSKCTSIGPVCPYRQMRAKTHNGTCHTYTRLSVSYNNQSRQHMIFSHHQTQPYNPHHSNEKNRLSIKDYPHQLNKRTNHEFFRRPYNRYERGCYNCGENYHN